MANPVPAGQGEDLTAADRLFTLVNVFGVHVLIVKVHIVHVLHQLVGRIARLLEANGKPCAVEVGGGAFGQGTFLHRGKIFRLVIAIEGCDNRENVLLRGAIEIAKVVQGDVASRIGAEGSGQLIGMIRLVAAGRVGLERKCRKQSQMLQQLRLLHFQKIAPRLHKCDLPVWPCRS